MSLRGLATSSTFTFYISGNLIIQVIGVQGPNVVRCVEGFDFDACQAIVVPSEDGEHRLWLSSACLLAWETMEARPLSLTTFQPRRAAKFEAKGFKVICSKDALDETSRGMANEEVPRRPEFVLDPLGKTLEEELEALKDAFPSSKCFILDSLDFVLACRFSPTGSSSFRSCTLSTSIFNSYTQTFRASRPSSFNLHKLTELLPRQHLVLAHTMDLLQIAAKASVPPAQADPVFSYLHPPDPREVTPKYPRVYVSSLPLNQPLPFGLEIEGFVGDRPSFYLEDDSEQPIYHVNCRRDSKTFELLSSLGVLVKPVSDRKVNYFKVRLAGSVEGLASGKLHGGVPPSCSLRFLCTEISAVPYNLKSIDYYFTATHALVLPFSVPSTQ